MTQKRTLIGLYTLLFALCSQANDISSTNSGRWSDAGTWDLESVPTMNDLVLIQCGNTVVVETEEVQVGNVRFEGANANINLNTGGSLKVVASDPFTQNGRVSYSARKAPMGFNINGGNLVVESDFRLTGSDVEGVANIMNVISGSVDVAFLEIGWLETAGEAKLYFEGSDASFRISEKLILGAKAILSWVADEDGLVTPIVSDNWKEVSLAGDLVVDLSSAIIPPSEIILINKYGPDPITGTFANVSIIGSTSYEVSYTGGDGNDLSLVLVSSEKAGILLAGWTQASNTEIVLPSVKNPNVTGFKVNLRYHEYSGFGNKFDRGCSDRDFGSLFPGMADEVACHSSTSTFTLKEVDVIELSITNHMGENHEVILNGVLADFTAPFWYSQKQLSIAYDRGDLGIPEGTVVGFMDVVKNSMLTGYNDYSDLDASMLNIPVAARTLENGQYAVFSLTVGGGNGDEEAYIDNIGISGVYTQIVSSKAIRTDDQGSSSGGEAGSSL